MITEEKYYGCVCDNCGEAWFDDHNGYAAFATDDSMAENVSNDEEWHTDHDADPTKHYCSKCFKIDDEDNLIINSERTNPQPIEHNKGSEAGLTSNGVEAIKFTEWLISNSYLSPTDLL